MIISETLKNPISEDAPCGDDLEYDPRFQELEQAQEGEPERVMGDSVIPAEEPDWKQVKTLALTLLGETHDLRIAVYLVRALAHTDGFEGVNEGLELIHHYLAHYWECVHPQLDPDEDNDPTFRINVLENLDDPAFFLNALKTIPLVEVKGVGKIDLRTIEAVADDEGSAEWSPELISAAFREAPPEVLATSREQIAQAAEHLQAIRVLVTEKAGAEQAPPFKRATALFQRLQEPFEQYAPETGPLQETQAPEGDSPSAVQAAPTQIHAFRNREEIARVLDLMCEYFDRHEPTSPVLLRRAQRLMTKNFMELVEELANDGARQAATILGVSDED